MAVLDNIVIRGDDQPELYALTADLYTRYVPDNPDWGHAPTEAEVRANSTGWGPPHVDHHAYFGPAIIRWYPTVQWFDGDGIADHLRTLSPYRRLDETVREPLLDAIAERVRTSAGNRIGRHYLSVLRARQRTGALDKTLEQ